MAPVATKSAVHTQHLPATSETTETTATTATPTATSSTTTITTTVTQTSKEFYDTESNKPTETRSKL